jgi:hypothetical protein
MVGAVVVLAAAVVAATTKGRPVGRRVDGSAARVSVKDGGRPECPSDSILIPLQDSLGNRTGAYAHHIPLAGAHDIVREYNDCQAFVDQTGAQYVGIAHYALFAIWAADPKLVPYATRLDSARIGRRSLRTSPYRGASSAARAWIQQLATLGMGIPFATIHDYGPDHYQPLGITPGFNCVYIWADAGDLRLRARMVSQPMNPSCTTPLSDPGSAHGKELVVRFTPHVMYRDSSLPPVSRWDWDSINTKQYAGMKCGPLWCEVGDSDLVTSSDRRGLGVPFDADPATGGEEASRVKEMKGWYDEEQLAVPGPGGQLRPSGIWATIFPHPRLGSTTSPGELGGGWHHVSTLYLRGTFTGPEMDVYVHKLGLYVGMNRVYFCTGAWGPGGCSDPSGRPAPTCTGGSSPLQYWSKVVAMGAPPGTRPVYHCVMPRPYSDVPGTARWRWKWDDQTTWIRCPTGCCEVEPN